MVPGKEIQTDPSQFLESGSHTTDKIEIHVLNMFITNRHSEDNCNGKIAVNVYRFINVWYKKYEIKVHYLRLQDIPLTID